MTEPYVLTDVRAGQASVCDRAQYIHRGWTVKVGNSWEAWQPGERIYDSDKGVYRFGKPIVNDDGQPLKFRTRDKAAMFLIEYF